MKKTNKTYLSGSVLTATVMGAYVVNFVFNAYLGRVLSFEAFGLITFLNILFYIVNIFYNALSLTVNQHIAYINNKQRQQEVTQFVRFTVKRVMLINLLLMCVWLISSPFITSFFQIGNSLIVYLFSLVVLLYPLVFISRGYLQGKFFFISVAIITIAEALIKLIGAVSIVTLHLDSFVYLSLYISSLSTVILATLLLLAKQGLSNWNQKAHSVVHFPFKFYMSSLVTGLSTISFLAIDVVLIKHFMTPNLAGQYSLLSLIGKIIYFLGSLLNVFIISLVGKYEGQQKNPLVNFYKIFIGSCVLAGAGYVGLGLFGSTFVPLLFGKKAMAILPYLNLYTLTILLFTLGNSIVTFHLAKRQYIFPFLALLVACLFILGIVFFHQNINQVVNTIFVTSIINTIVLIVPHILLRNKTNDVPVLNLLQEEVVYE